MEQRWWIRAGLVGMLVGVVGCGSSVTSGPTGGADGGADGGGVDTPMACGILCADLPSGCHWEGAGPCTCGTMVCTDAGPVDVTPPRDVAVDVPAAPDAVCVIDCAAPPPGCHYEGSGSCDPPRCPTLVCGDAGVTDTGVADAGAVDPDAAVVCGVHGHESFPTFDRTCRADTDCVVADHTTDCCGNSHALGIRGDQQMAFTVAERTCTGMYPSCGCPAGPTVADDGMTAVPPAVIAVRCQTGLCTTFVQR